MDGQLQFNENQAPVWEEEEVLEVDGVDGGATVWKYLYLKIGDMVGFMLYVCYNNFFQKQ